jgi:hypothetical protein
VTDQTHPLFGRRFQVLSVSTPLNTSGHVFVRYREKAVLQIPITATNLAPSPITTRTTELTQLKLNSPTVSRSSEGHYSADGNHVFDRDLVVLELDSVRWSRFDRHETLGVELVKDVTRFSERCDDLHLR